MKSADQLTAEEQSAILAERYTLRADAYDAFWSPVIRPLGELLLAASSAVSSQEHHRRRDRRRRLAAVDPEVSSTSDGAGC